MFSEHPVESQLEHFIKYCNYYILLDNFAVKG